MAASRKYIFGPVPSRRLGMSLGVDIVPFKTCTQNCIYCQLGTNAITTSERKPWVRIAEVLAELKAVLDEGTHADYITISGSGEPTLNSDLGQLVDGIKALSDIPVAIVTNGTLLVDPAVRADCCKADVIMPSLDAGDETAFRLINHPHRSITLRSLVDGLSSLRNEYSGRIWLEVFIVEGVNTSGEQLEKIRRLIGYIRPDKVHLNTAVRPTAEKGVAAVSPARLREIAGFFGPVAEVIADFSAAGHTRGAGADAVAGMLRRRPCSLADICASTGLNSLEAVKIIEMLMGTGEVVSEIRGDVTFYHAK
ncbi:MAG TPA: radical SAM protein [Sedimentisphaerales bacterium]|nr:radical SAM protein [Sedimentisphaerales bacterium]